MRHWYLLQTKPRLENTAVQHLLAQNFSVFMPTIVRQRLKKNHWAKLVEPMFPNYLFIELDMEVDHWSSVKNTKGVNKLVSFGNKPARIPEMIVEDIRQLNAQEVTEADTTFPKPGAAIKVQLGDESIDAILDIEDANQRVWIFLELLGRKQHLLVHKDQIRMSH